MKRILSFALIIVSLFSITSCSREKGEVPIGMKLASSDTAEFYMYVPKDWEVTTEKDSLLASARASESDPSNITMIGFADGSDEYKTIDDFWEFYKGDFETRIFDFEAPEGGAEKVTTFKLTNEGESLLVDNVAAKKYEYNGKIAGSEFYCKLVLIKIDSVFYIFTYTSTPALYSKHEKDVETILDYIEFK